MEWLQASDFLVPANPYAALFFGVMLTVIAGIAVWAETKERKMVLVVLITGFLVSLIGVTLLYLIGFYDV
jgi:glucose uptake protein GlcU